eukprot:m.199255 g.199255  ORF g.199255 m.199255 type:complete len:970 (-) comp18386_c1_seq11:2331-5240(-)
MWDNSSSLASAHGDNIDYLQISKGLCAGVLAGEPDEKIAATVKALPPHGEESVALLSSLHEDLVRVYTHGDAYRSVSLQACLTKLKEFRQANEPLGALSAAQAKAIIAAVHVLYEWQPRTTLEFSTIVPQLPLMLTSRELYSVLAPVIARMVEGCRPLVLALISSFHRGNITVVCVLANVNNLELFLDVMSEKVAAGSDRAAVQKAIVLFSQVLHLKPSLGASCTRSFLGALLNLIESPAAGATMASALWVLSTILPHVCKELFGASHERTLQRVLRSLALAACWALQPEAEPVSPPPGAHGNSVETDVASWEGDAAVGAGGDHREAGGVASDGVGNLQSRLESHSGNTSTGQASGSVTTAAGGDEDASNLAASISAALTGGSGVGAGDAAGNAAVGNATSGVAVSTAGGATASTGAGAAGSPATSSSHRPPSTVSTSWARACVRDLFTTLYGLFPGPVLAMLRDLRGEQAKARDVVLLPLFSAVQLHPYLLMSQTAINARWKRMTASDLATEGNLYIVSSRAGFGGTAAPTASATGSTANFGSLSLGRRRASRRLSKPSTDDVDRDSLTSIGMHTGAESHATAGAAPTQAHLSTQQSFDEASTTIHILEETSSTSSTVHPTSCDDTVDSRAHSRRESLTGSLGFVTVEPEQDSAKPKTGIEQQLDELYQRLGALRSQLSDPSTSANSEKPAAEADMLMYKCQLCFEQSMRSRHLETIGRLQSELSRALQAAARYQIEAQRLRDFKPPTTQQGAPPPEWTKDRDLLQQKLHRAEEQNMALRRQVALQAMEASSSLSQAEVDRLSTKVEALQLKYDAAADKLHRASKVEKHISQMTQKLLQWEAGLPTREAIATFAKKAVAVEKAYQHRVATLQEELDRTLRLAQDADSNFAQMRSKCDALARQLHDRTEATEQLKQTLEHVKVAAAAQHSAVQDKYASLKKINIAFEARILELEAEIAAAEGPDPSTPV